MHSNCSEYLSHISWKYPKYLFPHISSHSLSSWIIINDHQFSIICSQYIEIFCWLVILHYERMIPLINILLDQIIDSSKIYNHISIIQCITLE